MNPLDTSCNNDEGKILKADNFYWVASRYIMMNKTYLNYGLRIAGNLVGGSDMYYSNNDISTNNRSLRPIVSIKTNKIRVCNGENSISNMHQIIY